MFNRYLIYLKGSTQFMVLCLITSMSFLIGAMLINSLNQQWLGISSEELMALKRIPDHVGEYIKWTNAFFLSIALLLPALLYSYLSHPSPVEYLRWNAPSRNHHWLWGLTLLLIALPFSTLLEQWNQNIPGMSSDASEIDQYTKVANSMLAGTSISDLIANILAISILPALIEELFFRACLQQVLINWMRKTPFTAILLVAVLFSLFHGQLSGFFPRVFLGLIIGLTFYFSGSIWLAIAMHAANNFIAVVFSWLSKNNYLRIDINHLPSMNVYFGLCSALACCIFIYYFYKDRVNYLFYEVPPDDVSELLN